MRLLGRRRLCGRGLGLARLCRSGILHRRNIIFCSTSATVEYGRATLIVGVRFAVLPGIHPVGIGIPVDRAVIGIVEGIDELRTTVMVATVIAIMPGNA